MVRVYTLIKWPVQFAGFVLLAWLLVGVATYGYATRGWLGLAGGALLAFGLVGLAWFGARWALLKIAEWLMTRALHAMREVEATAEEHKGN